MAERKSTRFAVTITVEFDAKTVHTAKERAQAITDAVKYRKEYVKSVDYTKQGRLSIVKAGDLTIEQSGEDVVPEGSENACWCCDEPHSDNDVTCPDCLELVHEECIDPNHGVCEVCVGNNSEKYPDPDEEA